MKFSLLLCPFLTTLFDLAYSKVNCATIGILFNLSVYIYHATVFMWSKKSLFCLFFLGFSFKTHKNQRNLHVANFQHQRGHSFGTTLQFTISVMGCCPICKLPFLNGCCHNWVCRALWAFVQKLFETKNVLVKRMSKHSYRESNKTLFYLIYLYSRSKLSKASGTVAQEPHTCKTAACARNPHCSFLSIRAGYVSKIYTVGCFTTLKILVA